MEKIELVMSGDTHGVEIRTGDALPLKEPSKVSVSGDINTIRNYLQKRRLDAGYSTQGVYPDKAIVYTDKPNRTITIDIDPENHYGAKVKGALLINPDLQQFGINSQKQYNREALVKLLRFTKRFFSSADVHLNVLSSYQTFKASAKTEHENSSDQRGNRANHFVKLVDTTLPTTFVLCMPIFKGQPDEKFLVEICLDVTDGGAHFWFESPELEEIMALRTEEIFEDQLKEFSDLVVVNV